MSVINMISTPNLTPASAAPVKAQASAAPAVVDRAVAMQGQVVQEQAQEAKASRKDVQEVVQQANSQLSQSSRERVSFSYEERLNRLYVQVRDNTTGEVVKEIPPRQVIEHMAAVSEMIGLILDKNA
ncbi:MAG: flagellar protein FlaG [Mariprofundaceae bacterium]